MQVIAGPSPIRDPEKQGQPSPAVVKLLKGIKLKDHANIRFSQFDQQPTTYTSSQLAFAVKGTSEFVYVLFQLNFKGDKKRRFYKMAIGSFQQCFDDYMNHQGSLTAFSCVVCKDEHAVNLRAQRIVEFVVENDQNSVEYADDTDGFALQSYHMLVEPEFREACRRRAWRGIPKPRL